MSKNNDSMRAYKKAKKATAALNLSAKAAGEGSSQPLVKPPIPSSPGPRRAIPTPRVRQVDPPQSSVAASGPPASKKQRTTEPFNLDAPDFDAVEFVDQQIGPYGVLPMDDVSILHHFDYITRSGIKLAHMGAALYRTAQSLPLHATKAFMEEAKQEFDRMKDLKGELEVRVARLEKDLENEKAISTSLAGSLKLAEDTAMRHKNSYLTSYREVLRLREELENARENYSELQGHLVGSVTAAYENLKEQVRVIAPEADLSLFSLENVVRDGKVVPDDEDEDDVDPPPVTSSKVSTSAAPAEVGPPVSDPDCQILNRDDGTVDAVPLQTRPPSPRPDAAKKSSDS
ncbi:uncharacterized protein DS421_14g471280 [Arachis hypogaea]|nr:uncharacterized protein DS421_14g471280 [Arachis hypogaea]